MDIDAVKTSYARWAPIYDKTFGALTARGRRHAVSYINSLGAADVLEVGVGTGLALPYYNPEIRVTGIDYSHDMLSKAEEKVGANDLAAVRKLRQMDARSLDFPDESFDIVAAMHCISVVPEPRKVMDEIVRVLRPGGKVVVTNHFASEKGILAKLERWSSSFSDVLGWHSDFEIGQVTDTSSLALIQKSSLPPLGIMTFLVLEKTAA